MREIIGVIAHLLGRNVRVQVDPGRLRPVDKQVQVACTDTLHATVGWRPSLPLRDGLARLLRFEALL
jgi:nucleoside-diphosphate-sugar epimerase